MRLKHYRPDANQAEIVDALRKAGATVQDLACVGDGCADLLVAAKGWIWLLEVKRPKQKLTPAECRFFEAWGPWACVVHSPAEALAAVGMDKK